MNARYKHYTLTARELLIAVLACALAGCWEEIHYTPPAKAPAVAITPQATEAEASDFADDVAESLAPPPASVTPPDNRYGETASAVGNEPATSAATARAPTESAKAPPALRSALTPPATDPARNSRRMAWLLGSNLSLAALANDRGTAEEKVADWFDKSQQLAKLLGTTAVELPPRPATPDVAPSAGQVIDYLFAQGQGIGRDLAAQHGDDHVALFEMAVKSNILLVLYRPQAPVVEALAAAIEQSGERAALPVELYEPLLKQIQDGAPQAAVRDAVFQLHADIDRHLRTVQP